MNEIIQLFQKMYSEVSIEDNQCLSDMKKILCCERNNAIVFDIDNGYPDTYYEIVCCDESRYRVNFRERGSCNTKYEGDNINITVAALFLIILRFIPKSVEMTSMEEEITHEIRQGNISSAKELILKTFGDKIVSFDKNEYRKISVISFENSSIRILYQNHSLAIPTSKVAKLGLERGYLIAFRECCALRRFNIVVASISNMIGMIPQQEIDKISYVFFTGLMKNE